MKKDLLNMFLKAATDFSDGDMATGADGFQIEIDLDGSGEYEVLCYTSSGEQFNDAIETIWTSCSTESDNVLQGVDYAVPYEAYLKKGTVAGSIYDRGLDLKGRTDVPVKITNTLMDKVKEFKALITISEVSVVANEFMKMSGEIKKSSGTITESVTVPVIPPEGTSATRQGVSTQKTK